ncbi:MAG: EAL domain-containing protein [Proteobacteria bacterium]|nr:EAL domain-containing protein [Pseudomonadota bacterium]
MVEKSQANILVVENAKKGQKALWEAVHLDTFNTQIFKAKSIKEAIKIVLEKKVDGIIIDFQVEDGEALELLDAINQISVRVIPIIVLADKEQEKKGILLFRKGARDFLVKDAKKEYLKRLSVVLERILNEEIRYLQNSRLKQNTQAVLASVSEGIIGLSLAGTITFVNPAAADFFETPFETLVGKSIEGYAKKIDENFMKLLKQSMNFVKSSNQVVVIGQFSLSLQNQGATSLIEVILIPVFNELLHLEGYVLSLKDISQTKYLKEEIRLKSFKDELTGLFNRKSFLYRLEHVISYCKRYHSKCAVLFIDLDGFKVINDAFGHLCGDEILLTVADRIQSVIRETDILARVGGDEFMVLLNQIARPNDVAKVAMKINNSLLPAIEINKDKYHVTASIGIALYPNDSKEALKLVQYADFAMSLAKKQGKNHYQFYKSELNLDVEKMMKLSNDLRYALQNNQLEMYYHPQISSATGALVGLESLVRWNHPELGIISPSEFVPIAEEIGFIGEIGKWVLNGACESYSYWMEQGLDNFTLSINFSVYELLRDDFVHDVIHCLKKYRIDPHRFQLEITESIFVSDANVILAKLLQLKNHGFQIAMDDFGTGYSCLSYLKDLPIDIIKIDQSFVQALSYQNNERHKAIIATIIDLAKRLHLTTLAEGVETKEQAEYLIKLGCEYLQGFLFAKPMNFKHATEFIQLNASSLAHRPYHYTAGKTTH